MSEFTSILDAITNLPRWAVLGLGFLGGLLFCFANLYNTVAKRCRLCAGTIYCFDLKCEADTHTCFECLRAARHQKMFPTERKP